METIRGLWLESVCDWYITVHICGGIAVVLTNEKLWRLCPCRLGEEAGFFSVRVMSSWSPLWVGQRCAPTARPEQYLGDLAGQGRESAISIRFYISGRNRSLSSAEAPAVRSVVFRPIEHDKDSVLPFGDRQATWVWFNSALILLVIRVYDQIEGCVGDSD